MAASVPTLRLLFTRLDLGRRSRISMCSHGSSGTKIKTSADKRHEPRMAQSDSERMELTNVGSAGLYEALESEGARSEAGQPSLDEENKVGITKTVEVSVHY